MDVSMPDLNLSGIQITKPSPTAMNSQFVVGVSCIYLTKTRVLGYCHSEGVYWYGSPRGRRESIYVPGGTFSQPGIILEQRAGGGI
jgi:hypothetical protein